MLDPKTMALPERIELQNLLVGMMWKYARPNKLTCRTTNFWGLFGKSRLIFPAALLGVTAANAQEVTYSDVVLSYTGLDQDPVELETYDLSGSIEVDFGQAFLNANFNYTDIDANVITSQESALRVLAAYQLAPGFVIYGALATLDRNTDDENPVDYTLGLERIQGLYVYGFDITGGQSEGDFSTLYAGYQVLPDTEIALIATHNTNFQTTDYSVVLSHQAEGLEINALLGVRDEATTTFGSVVYEVSPEFRTLASLFAVDTPVSDSSSYAVGGGWQAAPDLWIDVSYRETFSNQSPNGSAVQIAAQYSVGKQRLQRDRIRNVSAGLF